MMIIIKRQDFWLKISDVRFVSWDLGDSENSEVCETSSLGCIDIFFGGILSF